jgi:hypothetical protein
VDEYAERAARTLRVARVRACRAGKDVYVGPGLLRDERGFFILNALGMRTDSKAVAASRKVERSVLMDLTDDLLLNFVSGIAVFWLRSQQHEPACPSASAGRKRQTENEILSTMATMVGAMVLARAVDDAALSDRILTAARTQLVEQK